MRDPEPSPPAAPAPVPVILLCAGYGTRMAAAGGGRPKALLPVGGRAVLDWLLDELEPLPGRGPFHLVTNALHAPAFRRWAAPRAVALTVWDDGTGAPAERLGAVGDLGWLLERLGSIPPRALVAAGDNVFRFPLAPIWERMLTGEGPAVLALTEDDPERLRRTGVLELAEDDSVRALWEKPVDPPTALACPPFYLLEEADLAAVPGYLSQGGSHDEIGRFIAWRARSTRVRALRVAGRRLDIGDPESWRAADAEMARSHDPTPPSPQGDDSPQNVRTTDSRRFRG